MGDGVCEFVSRPTALGWRASAGTNVQVWDVTSGKRFLPTGQDHGPGDLSGVSLSADRLAYVMDSRVLRICDIDRQEVLQSLQNEATIPGPSTSGQMSRCWP